MVTVGYWSGDKHLGEKGWIQDFWCGWVGAGVGGWVRVGRGFGTRWQPRLLVQLSGRSVCVFIVAKRLTPSTSGFKDGARHEFMITWHNQQVYGYVFKG